MRITLKIIFVLLFFSLLIMKATPSYAWHGHDGWRGHGYVGINLGVWPGPYYGYGYGYPYSPYYADPYYYPGYAVVSSPTYQPVVVNGATYYENNGAYYIYTQYGYQAVATPVGVTAPIVQTGTVVAGSPVSSITDTDDSFTVNIPNEKGGYSPVLLKRSGKGFIGPQGEFYAEFPKVSQLKLMYGK
jgi:hypothetical protein